MGRNLEKLSLKSCSKKFTDSAITFFHFFFSFFFSFSLLKLSTYFFSFFSANLSFSSHFQIDIIVTANSPTLKFYQNPPKQFQSLFTAQ